MRRPRKNGAPYRVIWGPQRLWSHLMGTQLAHLGHLGGSFELGPTDSAQKQQGPRWIVWGVVLLRLGHTHSVLTSQCPQGDHSHCPDIATINDGEMHKLPRQRGNVGHRGSHPQVLQVVRNQNMHPVQMAQEQQRVTSGQEQCH